MVTDRSLYQIGEVAKQTDCSIDTIRFYEKEGLLVTPSRTDGGFRKYAPQAVERIRFIKKAKSFGLTLSEIKQIMRESEKGLENCCRHVNAIFTHKLDELESKIKELQTMKKGLRALMGSWIPLEKARSQRFSICPQIEVERKFKKGRKHHVKKKS
ncbi:MAG: heavy metal-responsive transcriptional regulator [Candidatus Omnitrophota bacterium]|nr:heavy metal-responsive transcriptional regulator [Candidatus Omnitrophota bacterium]